MINEIYNSEDIMFFINETGVIKINFETIISKSAWKSYCYAIDILKGRFELGEITMSRITEVAYFYAKDVLKGRFKLGEETISQNPFYSYLYAKNIIKGRFKLGEKTTSPDNSYCEVLGYIHE